MDCTAGRVNFLFLMMPLFFIFLPVMYGDVYNPLLYYSFDDGQYRNSTGTLDIDITPSGTITNASGILNNAINTSNGFFLTDSAFYKNYDWSMSVWLKAESENAGYIASRRPTSSLKDFEISDGGGVDKIYLLNGNGGSGADGLTSNINLNPGDWSYLVIQKSGFNIKGWLNGQNLWNTTTSYTNNASFDMGIGDRKGGLDTFTGLMDEFSLYGYALSTVPQPVEPYNITITPDLNLNYFGTYQIDAVIEESYTTAYINITNTINNNEIYCWEYYYNASCLSGGSRYYNFTTNTSIYHTVENLDADLFYPAIAFAEDHIFWNNTPNFYNITKNNFHLINVSRSFATVPNRTYFIEVDARPNAATTKNLELYIVSGNQDLSYFTTNWVTGSDTVLIDSININDPYNHTHNYSKHYLTQISLDNDALLNSVNISDSFYIVLYDDHTQLDRAWNISYRSEPLCNTTDIWYNGDGTVTPSALEGCPDVHIHTISRSVAVDGIKVQVHADNLVNSTIFNFAALPNIAPNPSDFITPTSQNISDSYNITWNKCIDVNNDPITYSLFLVNVDKSANKTLATGLNNPFYYWDTTTTNNSQYDLKVECCDSVLCSNFYHSDKYDYFGVFNAAETNETTTTTTTSTTAALDRYTALFLLGLWFLVFLATFVLRGDDGGVIQLLNLLQLGLGISAGLLFISIVPLVGVSVIVISFTGFYLLITK